MDKGLIQETADIYNGAVAAGDDPTATVSARMGIAYRTAGWRVSHARAAGLIPQLQGNKTGKRNKRALAVATALGIDYETLVSAVIEHAGGDLRVSR